MSGPIESPASPARPPRRRLRRLAAALGTLVLLVAAMVVAAPYLLVGPLRDRLIRRLFTRVNGEVTVRDASLGWFSPVVIEGVTIRDPQGEDVIAVERIRGDRDLWRMVTRPRELGVYTIERPRLEVVVTEQGSNLAAVFPRPADQQPGERKYPELPNIAAGVRIDDAVLTYRGPHTEQPWRVENVDLALALRPGNTTASGLPEIVVEPCRPLDRVPVTRPMTKDLLQYIAPALAGATQIDGQVSLDLDRWRIDYRDLPKATGNGKLTVHRIDLAGSRLMAALTELLHLPGKVRVVDESEVAFEMVNGRVFHKGFAFGVSDYRITTYGSVGVEDKSLDLVAQVPVPPNLLAGRPLGEALREQIVEVHVTGTLDRPRIDRDAFRQEVVRLALTTTKRLLDGGGILPPEVRARFEQEGFAGLLNRDEPLAQQLIDVLRRRDLGQYLGRQQSVDGVFNALREGLRREPAAGEEGARSIFASVLERLASRGLAQVLQETAPTATGSQPRGDGPDIAGLLDGGKVAEEEMEQLDGHEVRELLAEAVPAAVQLFQQWRGTEPGATDETAAEEAREPAATAGDSSRIHRILTDRPERPPSRLLSPGDDDPSSRRRLLDRRRERRTEDLPGQEI